MSDGSLELQNALIAALDGNLSDLDSAAVLVYDRVPQDQPPPFVVVGASTAVPDDAKTFNGVDHLPEMHAYSSHRGRKEVKHILGQIYDVLHTQKITVVGFESVCLRYQFSDTFEEPDGTRGVIRFGIATYS